MKMQLKEIEIISKKISNSNEIEILKILHFLFYGVERDLVEDRGKLKQDLLEFPGWKIKPKNVTTSYLEDKSDDTLNKIFQMLDLTLIDEGDNFKNILRLFDFFYNLNKIKENNESVSSVSTVTDANADIKKFGKLLKLRIQKLIVEKDSLIDKKNACNNKKDATEIAGQITKIEKQINKLKYDLLKMKTGFYNSEGLDGKCASETFSNKVSDWLEKNPLEQKLEQKLEDDKIKRNVETKGNNFKEYDEIDAISTSTRYTVTSSQLKEWQLDREKFSKQAEELKKDNQKLKENLEKTQIEGNKLKDEFNKLKISCSNVRSVARYEPPSTSYYDDSRYQMQMWPSSSYCVTPSYSGCSSRGNSSSEQSVSTLTGIGKTNTGRLNSAGFNTVADLRNLSRSVGGNQARFEQAMGSLGVSKRYARTAFKDL